MLEHRYLTGVERPHGLPTRKRQRLVHVGRTRAYRGVEYLQLDTVVELDGRLGHDGTQDRWDDLDRDIAGIVGGMVTYGGYWISRVARRRPSISKYLRAASPPPP